MKFHDDDNLIQFLKGHEPSPLLPPASKHEEELMALIAVQPEVVPPAKKFSTVNSLSRLPRSLQAKGVWVLPTAIAAGLLMVVGHQQWQQNLLSNPEMTEITAEVLPVPVVRTHHERFAADQELETFLEDSWSNSLGEHGNAWGEPLTPSTRSHSRFVVNTTPSSTP